MSEDKRQQEKEGRRTIQQRIRAKKRGAVQQLQQHQQQDGEERTGDERRHPVISLDVAVRANGELGNELSSASQLVTNHLWPAGGLLRPGGWRARGTRTPGAVSWLAMDLGSLVGLLGCPRHSRPGPS